MTDQGSKHIFLSLRRALVAVVKDIDRTYPNDCNPLALLPDEYRHILERHPDYRALRDSRDEVSRG